MNKFHASRKWPSRVEEEIPVCSRGVSDRRVASPGPVFTSDGRIRKQPCGRYDSNPSCIYLALRHGPLQHFRSPKGRATPLRNTRNINSILRLLECDTAVLWQPSGVQFALWSRGTGGPVGHQWERVLWNCLIVSLGVINRLIIDCPKQTKNKKI